MNMSVNYIICGLCFFILLYIIASMVYDMLKTVKSTRYYEDEFKKRGLQIGRAYLINKNGKDFLFQAYFFSNLGIHYYWTDLSTGEIKKFCLSNMQEMFETKFVEYNKK